MADLRKAAEIALEALELARDTTESGNLVAEFDSVVTVLRLALEQQQAVECLCGLCKLEQTEYKQMVEKGTKAWADTPDNWVDELRND